MCLLRCRENSVHADIGTLIALHEPSLLKAYYDGNIVDFVEDEYFQKSLVLPKDTFLALQEIVATSASSNKRGRRRVLNSPGRTKVACPICPVSWFKATLKNVNVKRHIVKYHSHLVNGDVVRKFCEKYSVSLK